MIAVAETQNCIIGIYKVGVIGRERLGQLCMNQSIADPRTPFTMLAMTFCPKNKLLAGCTARNSALLFQLSTELDIDPICPIKTYYGMTTGIYDFPAISFSLDGSFLLITSGSEILVFEVKSGHKVFSLPGSTIGKPIRALSRLSDHDIIATVSFDKTLRIFN
jgi:WD40 repeat protein